VFAFENLFWWEEQKLKALTYDDIYHPRIVGLINVGNLL